MINLILLTGALIQISADSTQQKTAMNQFTPEITTQSKRLVVTHDIDSGLSMEIQANLEAEFERMVVTIDEELTLNLDAHTSVNLYSKQN